VDAPTNRRHQVVGHLFQGRFKSTVIEAVETRLAPMATIAEVEKLALDLPETERAVLAAHLLGSLPSVLHDEDEGIAEALRRDAEFEANPSLGMSLEQLDQRIESRRS
jgi:putative addiction module component (TIGR02574 family)